MEGGNNSHQAGSAPSPLHQLLKAVAHESNRLRFPKNLPSPTVDMLVFGPIPLIPGRFIPKKRTRQVCAKRAELIGL